MTERLLGRGAMASVWLCRDPDGEAVAVKWMDLHLPGGGPEDETMTPPLLLRYEREVRSLARVAHPGIVRYRDHGQWKGRPYMVMDHVEGSDLRVYAEKLAQRPPAERYARCRTIGRSLCEALQAMHDVDLVHRDVKPSNVLVDPSGGVVLTDLGVVKDLAEPEHTSAGLVVGTIAYAAPEQLTGEGIGPWTDQFGVGATLYFLLTLERPFSTARQRVDGELTPPSRLDPELPADLEATLLRLMAPDPGDRFDSCADAAAALAVETDAPTGLPLAGRGPVVKRLTGWLDDLDASDRSHSSLIVQVCGPMGVGRRWLAGVLRAACARRGLTLVEPGDDAGLQVAVHRAATEPRVVVLARQPLAEPPPAGVAWHALELDPMGVADLRRTVVAAAPLTEDPAAAALRLHRFTGGLPALLLPLLERHGQGSRLVLPETLAAGSEVDPYLAGLDLDQGEVLGALCVCSGPVSLDRLERIACLPPEEALTELHRRGLLRIVDRGAAVPTDRAPCCDDGPPVHWAPDTRVALAAEAFRTPALDRLPDPDALRERARVAADQPGTLPPERPDPEALALDGHLAEARRVARAALDHAQAAGDRSAEGRALVTLGQVLLDLGDVDGASRVLADASALAKAIADEPLRRRAHVLRARAALDGHDLTRGRGRAAAASAMDRVVPMASGADGRTDPFDALLFATWARAAAALGDARAARRAADRAVSRLDHTPPGLHGRTCLALARAARLRKDPEAAWAALARVHKEERALPLLAWEIAVEEARLGGALPPDIAPLAEGLGEEGRERLAARR